MEDLGIIVSVVGGSLVIASTIATLIWRGGRWYEGVNQRLASLETSFLRFLKKFDQRIEIDDTRYESLEEKVDHVKDTCNEIHRNGGSGRG